MSNANKTQGNGSKGEMLPKPRIDGKLELDVDRDQAQEVEIKNTQNIQTVETAPNSVPHPIDTRCCNFFTHWLIFFPLIPLVIFGVGVILTFKVLDEERRDEIYKKLPVYGLNLIASLFLFCFKAQIKAINFFVLVKTVSTLCFAIFPTFDLLENILEIELDFEKKNLLVTCVYLLGCLTSFIQDIICNIIVTKKTDNYIRCKIIKQNYKAVANVLESLVIYFIGVGYLLYFKFYTTEDIDVEKNWSLFCDIITLPTSVWFTLGGIIILNILLLLSNCCDGTGCCWLLFLNFFKLLGYGFCAGVGLFRLVKHHDVIPTKGHIGITITLVGAFLGLIGSFSCLIIDFMEVRRIKIEESKLNN